MAETTGASAPEAIRTATSGWWGQWPEWAGYAAATWSLMYGALGLYWALGGAGFPFGSENDPTHSSILAGVRATVAAPVIAVMGLTGAVVAGTMARTRGSGARHAVMLAFAWTAATTLLLIVPDARVLTVVAYAPIFAIGAPFGWPPVSYADAITWPIVNQFICIAGGLAWATTAVAYQRRSRDACVYCGRTGVDAHWTTPAAAARWGRWAVYVAVIIPMLYAATRWAWALGIPLGISEEVLREGQATGVWWAGAGLATVATSGAILTLGLIQRWGEVFPRWIPFLSGRRVPPVLAIVPAALVSVLVSAAGLAIVRSTLLEALDEGFTENWATVAPALPWPLWGAALAAAALAYYYRRRGRCVHCGRG